MPTFATLVEFTPDAHEDGYTKAGYDEGVDLVEAYGGEVIATYYGDIVGYDVLVITEYPDHDSAYKSNLEFEIGSTVKSEVCEVRTAEEHYALAGDIGEQ